MTQLTVSTSIYAPIDKVRDAWTWAKHIMQRNHAGDDRHCPAATGDLRVGGTFSYTMAAKDGSFAFDYAGMYTALEDKKLIEYTLGEMKEYFIDAGRKVSIFFVDENCGTVKVTETFDAEEVHSLELQQQGRQSILDNFKKYVEAL